MRYVALATDYDGTLAADGRVSDHAVHALERLRNSGRRTVLVTGRLLEDLRDGFERLDLFDRVVAENGAMMFDPSTNESRRLAESPPDAFVDALRERGVDPLSVGHVIVATWEPNEQHVLDAIRELGLELQVTFNKGAVMVLPAGVTKATGLAAALDELGLSPHNVVGIGDAENDHAFLDACELSVAVANALPAVRDRCDHVTQGARGDGVIELIEVMLEGDLRELDDRVRRHDVRIGRTDDGTPVTVRPYRGGVLVAGSSGSGKSTLVTAFLEQLGEHGYQFCLIDPEGDYEHLERVPVLGTSERPATVGETVELLAAPSASVVVNLLGVPLGDRPGYLVTLLPQLQEMRAKTGRPHWLIVDEAHHLLPSALQTTPQTLPRELSALVMVTVHPDAMTPEALDIVDLVVTTSDPEDAFRRFADALSVEPPSADDLRPEGGTAVAWDRTSGEAYLFRPDHPSQARRRHVRKYAHGDVQDKAFYFRGPDGRLNLRVQNLALFVQIAQGVDDATWSYHLENGDYERWFREAIKDPELAGTAAEAAGSGADASETRARILDAIGERYTLPS